jgi:bifunctional DNA-binding transcriptional regulator/antitoxin component of YhaV-PrlF toxin-antitoxin module
MGKRTDMGDEIYGMSRISADGKVHLPVDVRRFLQVKEGENVLYILRANEIILKPAKPTKPEDPFGFKFIDDKKGR